ncbi:MAG TPA: hypothetical protein VIZ22_13050 [Candidatus Limnocylindrales bacterium]
MHPETLYELATMRIAEDHAYAARQRMAREAREARKEAQGANADPSLLDRITTALRNAVRPVSRPTAGVA